MVSRPTRGTSFLLTACSVTNRIVQRAWLATNHRDNALLLNVVEQLARAGARLIIERPVKTAFPITMSDLADCLRSKLQETSNLRRCHALRQPKKCDRTQYHSNLLNAATQQHPKLLLVFRTDVDTQG
jgi:hypothetical protein